MELRKRCYNNRLKPNTNKTKAFPIILFESDHLLISTIYSILCTEICNNYLVNENVDI